MQEKSMRFVNPFAPLRRPAGAAPRRHVKTMILALAGLLGASLAFATPSPLKATESAVLQKGEVEKIVHDYLIANPELIRDAIDELEKRQKVAEAGKRERAISQGADKMFNSRHQAVIGNPSGDVTLVEFFDYNCGYCKQALANVTKLIEGDPNLRVVLKDFPILGPSSVDAAQVATAVREQFNGQKFFEFHRKLLGTRGSIGKAQALAAAKDLGADMDRLEKDLNSPMIQESLKEVAELADQLHFEGTPSWVLGKEAIVGGVPVAQLKAKIDNLRKCGKTSC
jgi:protein-disulfide isomerase